MFGPVKVMEGVLLSISVIVAVMVRCIAEVAPGLPEGVHIVPVYDRSELIERAISTLKNTLLEESLIVALVCIVFLLHVRSALVAIIMLPIGVLIAFILSALVLFVLARALAREPRVLVLDDALAAHSAAQRVATP